MIVEGCKEVTVLISFIETLLFTHIKNQKQTNVELYSRKVRNLRESQRDIYKSTQQIALTNLDKNMKNYIITTALILSTRDWGGAGSNVKSSECPLVFIKMA